MLSNQVIFQAGLVSVGDLEQTATGRAKLKISVAKNYSRKEGEEWVNLDPIYVNLTLFDKMAELFLASSIPLGTPLFIVGRLSGYPNPGYQTKSGVTVPAHTAESVLVDAIGPVLTNKRIVSVSIHGSQGQSTQRTQSTPKPSAAAPKATKKEEAPVVEQEESNESTDFLFDDDDDYDIFADN